MYTQVCMHSSQQFLEYVYTRVCFQNKQIPEYVYTSVYAQFTQAAHPK